MDKKQQANAIFKAAAPVVHEIIAKIGDFSDQQNARTAVEMHAAAGSGEPMGVKIPSGEMIYLELFCGPRDVCVAAVAEVLKIGVPAGDTHAIPAVSNAVGFLYYALRVAFCSIANTHAEIGLRDPCLPFTLANVGIVIGGGASASAEAEVAHLAYVGNEMQMREKCERCASRLLAERADWEADEKKREEWAQQWKITNDKLDRVLHLIEKRKPVEAAFNARLRDLVCVGVRLAARGVDCR